MAAPLTGGVHASEQISFDGAEVLIITEGLDPGRVGLQIGPVFVLVDDRAAFMAALAALPA